MMFAELAGERVTEGKIVLPNAGRWFAEVTLDKEVTLSASGLSLVLADLRLACALWVPATPYQGKTRVRLVGGTGGWGREVPAKGYQSPGGVRLSLVLGDAAADCGEKIAIGADHVLGKHYSREEGPAMTHLNSLAWGRWWIDPDGTTRVGVRASSPVASPFSLTGFDGAKRTAMVATEMPADFVPGRTLKTPTLGATLKISCVTHVITKGALRTEVLAS